MKATFKAFTLMHKKKPYYMEKLWTMAAAMFNLQATRSQHQLQELMRRVYKKSPTLHILKEQAKLRLFFINKQQTELAFRFLIDPFQLKKARDVD